MPIKSPQHITQLLIDWSNGDQAALDKLMPLVYEELRKLARHYMRNERVGHTLQTTDLVHEAYLRLIDYKRIQWNERAHFFAIAAQVMRRILVEHARGRRRVKRGGGAIKISLDGVAALTHAPSLDWIALDEALTKLETFDKRKSLVVQLRYFGGLSNEEAAQVLNIHPNTVMLDWKFSKAYLRRELNI
jgi:RNA polymerase sigma-70 factor (ECF subfamily)